MITTTSYVRACGVTRMRDVKLPAPPIPMQQKDVATVLEPGRFAVCEKTDGERARMFIDDSGTACIVRNNVPSLTIATYPLELALSIVEGELLGNFDFHNEYTFVMFDCLTFNGRDVQDKRLVERLALLRRFEGDNVITKPFYFDAAAGSAALLSATPSPVIPCDGLVFTPTGGARKAAAFKWKPANRNSIDFYVNHQGPGVLCTRNSQGDLVPFYDSDDFCDRVARGRVAECVWNDALKSWRTMKIRPRSATNTTHVARMTLNSIRRPITEAMLRGEATPPPSLKEHHRRIVASTYADAAMRALRARRAGTYADAVRRAPRDLILADLMCGTGNDLRAWAAAGFRYVDGVDIDAENIAIAKRRLTVARRSALLPMVTLQEADMSDPDAFAAFHGGQYDVVSCHFAIHFAVRTLEQFLLGVASILRPGGVFVGTCMDGALVQKALAATKYRELKGQDWFVDGASVLHPGAVNAHFEERVDLVALAKAAADAGLAIERITPFEELAPMPAGMDPQDALFSRLHVAFAFKKEEKSKRPFWRFGPRMHFGYDLHPVTVWDMVRNDCIHGKRFTMPYYPLPIRDRMFRVLNALQRDYTRAREALLSGAVGEFGDSTAMQAALAQLRLDPDTLVPHSMWYAPDDASASRSHMRAMLLDVIRPGADHAASTTLRRYWATAEFAEVAEFHRASVPTTNVLPSHLTAAVLALLEPHERGNAMLACREWAGMLLEMPRPPRPEREDDSSSSSSSSSSYVGSYGSGMSDWSWGS